MPRNSGSSGSDNEVNPDMTPLIDVVFQLITFFIMIMTIAKDEQARKIRLPVAATAEILIDDQIPDSLNINVDRNAHMLSWGENMDLNTPAGWNRFGKLIKNESLIAKQKARAKGIDYKKKGLSTTLILRFDYNVDYTIFRRVMDMARQVGFTKYQLKAKEEGS